MIFHETGLVAAFAAGYANGQRHIWIDAIDLLSRYRSDTQIEAYETAFYAATQGRDKKAAFKKFLTFLVQNGD